MVVYGALIRSYARIDLRSGVRPTLGEINRAEMAVLALGLLGAGNLWAPLGPSGDIQPASPTLFVFGFAMIVVAGALCLLAIGGSPSFPRPLFCAAAIAVPLVLVPACVALLGS
jgi:hypothetical protein